MRSEMVRNRTILLGLLFPLLLSGQRFYDDDPLEKEPPPVHVEGVAYRGLNVYIELFHNRGCIAAAGQTQVDCKIIVNIIERPAG